MAHTARPNLAGLTAARLSSGVPEAAGIEQCKGARLEPAQATALASIYREAEASSLQSFKRAGTIALPLRGAPGAIRARPGSIPAADTRACRTQAPTGTADLARFEPSDPSGPGHGVATPGAVRTAAGPDGRRLLPGLERTPLVTS